ncbi:MAG TPA: class I SAM-dependent methyltransferase [Burkholderiales bacterium]|nr:class I SAM-dependent methyltransferase [Burkholderiales bacterium]
MKQKVPFSDLTYEKFRELARRQDLSRHEKVGFPDDYREGKEERIFADVRRKLRALDDTGKIILEIGPGCSKLPLMLIALCEERNHQLHLVDSPEMLEQLPNKACVHKWPGRYPDEVGALFSQFNGRVDAVIAYSVIQYVFLEGNLWDFLDRSLSLLAEGGELLFGDIPNVTMRKRFFSSATGLECHRRFTGRNDPPEVHFNKPEPGQIDDSVVFAMLARARAQGFHAWVLPQADDLPMANRREDILIRKP